MTEESGSTPIVWGDYVFLNAGSGCDLSLWAMIAAAQCGGSSRLVAATAA